MRFLRLPEVLNITALSRSSVYRLMDAGSFPASTQLSARSVAWVDEEVQSWVEQRVAEREGSLTSM